MDEETIEQMKKDRQIKDELFDEMYMRLQALYVANQKTLNYKNEETEELLSQCELYWCKR